MILKVGAPRFLEPLCDINLPAQCSANGAQQLQDRHVPGGGVVGVVGVPTWTRPPAQIRRWTRPSPSTTVSAWFRCQLPIGSPRTT
jgi:hypothetical protein